MIRRICIAILLAAFCVAQSSVLTGCASKVSPRGPEAIAQEIAEDLNEGRLEPGLRKWAEARKNWDDDTKTEFQRLIMGKLTPESLEKLLTGKETELKGTAEDLWGNKLDLSEYNEGLVWIHPFSPTNCGYCFVDGEFVKVNYCENAKREGGRFFGMCLFNPQLDVYSFLKHYREDITVLTGPTSLHTYHRDGFPYMIVFRDGELAYGAPISRHEEDFGTLRARFWGDRNAALRPTSPLHIATRFIWENESHLAVTVYPDGDEDAFRRAKERYKDSQALTVKYESQLTEEDYKKNLLFEGHIKDFDLSLFREEPEMPVRITSQSIQIGDYEFPKSDVALGACFSNPLNRERYIVFLDGTCCDNWVDYVICRYEPSGKHEILLRGLFEKDNGIWKFSQSLAFASEASRQFCRNGVCPAPATETIRRETHREHEISLRHEQNPKGELWTLGSSECRFPSILVDHDAICWAAWEEHGDIILASVSKGANQKTIYVENDPSDSFNPLLAMRKERIWIFYLNDQDRFYRLYGKYFDGRNLSDEILISEKMPLDVITPAVAFNDHGEIIVAWSEWRANQKFLRYRAVGGMILGDVQTIQTKTADGGYTCAWYPSLVLDDSGKLWGAWNQHYPTTLCTCAGDSVHEAKVVDEKGGYPSIIFDTDGRPWVLRESSMWDVLHGEPQTISASYYDSEKQKWSLPYTLSLKDQTILNQTPKAAVDKDGRICVVWSGRKDETRPWNIYISHFEGSKWSGPEIVSPESGNARAPAIFVGKSGEIWLTWHSGIGSKMKVKVLHLEN